MVTFRFPALKSKAHASKLQHKTSITSIIPLSMSTLEDLNDLEREDNEDKKDETNKDGEKLDKDGDTEMKDADAGKEKTEDLIDAEILHSNTRDIQARGRLLDNEMRIMSSEFQRLTHEQAVMEEKIKDNLEKIENNRWDRTALEKNTHLNAYFNRTGNYLILSPTL